MSSKRKCILRKRKDMLHMKVEQIAEESRNIIELIQDIQNRATSIVSDLNLKTDEREFLLKYPAVSRKLEEWQTQVSRISYDLDVLVCKESHREPEESNTTSTTLQGRQKIEKDSSTHEDVMLRTISCPLQENDILDMCFVSGDSPHDFWLRFYSTKELKEIRTGIQKLFETNKLEPLKSSEVLCDVCVCSGSDYFRGRIINQCTNSLTYMVLNVDNGSILKVEKDKIYRITEALAKFPVQAINCFLEGNLGDRALWDAYGVKLFHQVMQDSSLVVTICSVPTETCSKFMVKMDIHNEMRVENKIELSSWITNSVLPILAQKRTSKSADTMKLLFDFLRYKAELESNVSLKESDMTTECGSSIHDVEGKENEDSRELHAEDDANGISNIPKEKSNMQEPASKAAQHCSSFPSVGNMPVHAVIPHTEKSNLQHPPSNAVQQSSSFPSLNGMPLHSVLPHEDKSNAEEQTSSVHFMPSLKDGRNLQQQLPSVKQQFSEPLSLAEPPFYKGHPLFSQYVPHFLPHNPPMLVQNDPSPVNQPSYTYTPQIHSPLLEINPFHNPGPSVALQQKNPTQSFQLPISSMAQNRLMTKYTSERIPVVSYSKFLQSNAEDIQKGEKKKEAKLITNTLHATQHKRKTALAIKQTLSAEDEAVGGDFLFSKQEPSLTKENCKSTNAMSKVSLRYPNWKFEEGGRYQASVVHINNPDDFYVHIECKDTAFIKILDKKITENYKSCSVKLRNKELAKKMLHESWCAVFYEDMWLRGKVINWKDDDDTALEVLYVDYGEVREVDLSMIKPLKEEYVKLPICATQCRLANIHPPQLQENSEYNIWPPESIELFKVLAVRDKLHSIVVTNISSDPISVLLVTEDKVVINKALLDWEYAIAFKPIEFDPSLPIQLITENKENGKDEKLSDALNSLPIQLITENKENVGKEEKLNSDALNKPIERCQNTHKDSSKAAGDFQKADDKENILQNWDPMADEFFSDRPKYNENACYALSGTLPQDEQRICKFYAKNGLCFKGLTCTKEHSVPNLNRWTADQENKLQNPFFNLVLPPVGTQVTVEITAIYTLNMFYAHILWEGRIKEEGEEMLLTLNKCINSKDSVSKMRKPHIMPVVGQLVLARFMAGDNSNFFRAKVIATNIEENEVQVVYTDYGNAEWVSEKDIREMEPQYLHLPFQALECYISNVSPKTDSEEALLDLSDLILGRQLVGTLISKNIFGYAEIELWDGNQKVSDKLIEKGYADYRESPLF